MTTYLALARFYAPADHPLHGKKPGDRVEGLGRKEASALLARRTITPLPTPETDVSDGALWARLGAAVGRRSVLEARAALKELSPHDHYLVGIGDAVASVIEEMWHRVHEAAARGDAAAAHAMIDAIVAPAEQPGTSGSA